MAKPHKHSEPKIMPGLFDSLDDFKEDAGSDFNIIPDRKMEEIVREIRRERNRPGVIDDI